MYSEFESQKTLRAYQKSSIPLAVLFCFFFGYFDAWINLIAPAVFALLVCLSIFLEHINRHKLASILLIISLWLAPAWCIVFSGGLHSPLLIWLTPTIFMAGALIGSRWAMFLGSLSFSFIGIIFVQNDILAAQSEFQNGANLDLLFLLSGTSSVMLITFYGYVFTRDLKNKNAEIINERDKAIAANKVKAEFLSRMSHELRTPMNAILGFNQLMEMDAEDFNEGQRNNTTEITNAGHHLLHLIDELLDLNKIEAGTIEIAMASVSINDVLQQCLPLVQSQIKEKQVELIDNLSAQGHIVYADPNRLKQVLLNLLSNAAKYNKTYGHITLNSEVLDKERLRIRVTDTGEGLTEQDISKLFIPFERLKNKFHVDGTGIGLVISKSLTQLMNGSIGVESELNKGSTFWIELSRVEPPSIIQDEEKPQRVNITTL